MKLFYTVPIIYGLKIIGLAPFSHQNNHRTSAEWKFRPRAFSFSRIGLAYNLLILIPFQVVTVPTFSNLLSVSHDPAGPLTQAIIDTLQATISCFAVHVIIISWAVRQEIAAHVMNRLSEIECLLSGLERQLPLSNARMYTVLTVHVIFNASLWGAFLSFCRFGNMKSFGEILLWTLLGINTFVIYWFVVEYLVIVGHVAREFERVNGNLLKFEGIPKFLSRTPIFNDYLGILSSRVNNQLALLKLLRRTRTMLLEVSEDIADFFSFPILFCICYFFTILVYTFYYSIAPVLVSKRFEFRLATAYNVMWLVISACPLTLLSINVTKVGNQSKRTGRIVHKLLATAMQQEVEVELEQFSLELLHESFSFTAFGFFTLDCTMLQSILGATTTFLVILLQFMDPGTMQH